MIRSECAAPFGAQGAVAVGMRLLAAVGRADGVGSVPPARLATGNARIVLGFLGLFE